MTETEEDFDARLTRVLTVGAEALSVGRVVPPFGSFRAAVVIRERRRISREVAMLAVAVSLGVGGAAAAVVITRLRSVPVTETHLAHCYSVESLAGGRNFAGTSVAAAGPAGTHAQVTNALAACTTVWADGLLTLGLTEVGGTRQPVWILTPTAPSHPLSSASSTAASPASSPAMTQPANPSAYPQLSASPRRHGPSSSTPHDPVVTGSAPPARTRKPLLDTAVTSVVSTI